MKNGKVVRGGYSAELFASAAGHLSISEGRFYLRAALRPCQPSASCPRHFSSSYFSVIQFNILKYFSVSFKFFQYFSVISVFLPAVQFDLANQVQVSSTAYNVFIIIIVDQNSQTTKLLREIFELVSGPL